jgi:hypothetical protein
MRTPVARKLLGKMLEGEELEESDIRELAGTSEETLYVDFKDGAELNDLPKARRTVRQYVSGFANADGGLLVIGVRDGDPGKRTFTATQRPGGRPLSEWARNTLASLAGYLLPAPRIQVVVVEEVEVLLIGVARAPSLVPCVEDGDLRYYLRLADSTLSIPPYLISDLILGRREHPRLVIGVLENGTGAANGSVVHFGFVVENESMVPANDVVVGVICWGHPKRDSGSTARSVPRALLSFIDGVAPVDKLNGQAPILVHATTRASGRPIDLGGFEIGRAFGIGDFLVPRAPTDVPVRSALYVIANGHPPEWYQFDWLLPASASTISVARVERVGHRRPVVAWNREWRD